jgi:hypothetical protein
MRASGTEKRGQGGARATIVSRLQPSNGGTHIEVVTDYAITGRLASFGRSGMIEDISERLLREFAQCLQATLGSRAPAGADGAGPRAVPVTGGAPPGADPPAPVPAAEPIEGISLVGSVLWGRLRRHPGHVLAAALAIIAVVAAARRALRR